MAQNGKIYRHYETKFRTMDRETRMKCCLGSAMQVFQMCESMGMDESSSIALVELCAQFGVNYDGVLTADERKFAKEFFEAFIEDCDMNEIYEQLKQPLSDDFYGMLKFFVREAPMESLHLFLLILCFALSDEKVEDALALQMELIFAIPLMQHFSQSGLESVPDVEESVQISLTDLEAQIVEFYQKNNSMQCVDDIAAALPSYNKSSLVRALNSLCDKGVLKKVSMALGDLYSPVSTVDLSSLHVGRRSSSSPKKKVSSKSQNIECSRENRLAKLRKEFKEQNDAYNKERDQVEETRKIELEKALNAKKQNLQKIANDALEDAKQKYNQRRKECEERIAAAEKVLANAGFFQFGEKAEAKRERKAASVEMITAEEQYNLKKAEYRQAMQELDRKIEEKRTAVAKAIEGKYPLPTAPKKSEELKRLEEAEDCERIRNSFGSEYDYYVQSVLSVMDFTPASVTELIERSFELEKMPRYQVSRILRVLEHDGLVKSTGAKYLLA